jgi:hypothetical protein
VQQWADEIAKFAPSLRVQTYYATAAKKQAALANLRSTDILITTPHMKFPDGLLERITLHRCALSPQHLG